MGSLGFADGTGRPAPRVPRPGTRLPRGRATMVGSPGALLALIRQGAARSRSDLAAVTGLARSTVSQRVEALLAADLLYEDGEGPSTGGRPPVRLAFNAGAGVVLAADLGATHSRVAVTDLAGTALAEAAAHLDIADGPEFVLGWLQDTFERVLADCGRSAADVRGIGIGVPGPVEFLTGTPINPPIMPSWHGVPVSEPFVERYGVPVLVDNDVNLLAMGEHWARWAEVDDLMFVKVGTGVGCGIIAGGSLHRGAQGAAGDLGHVQVHGYPDAACRCGNNGCVEAIAGGAALARALTAAGLEARTSRDVARLVRDGEPAAARIVREAGRVLGDVLAAAVNLLNPAVLVVGGDVGCASEQLLAGIRETVYQRSLPLATRQLQIVRSLLEERAGITGAAAMVIEHVLTPEVVDAALPALLPS